MPDIEMDEEQLVGAITHMIGDKQVLIYMEQALAKVVASKNKLKALEVSAKELETKLKQGEAEVLRLDQIRVSKLADIDKEVSTYRGHKQAEVDKFIAELRATKIQELNTLEEELAGLQAQAAGIIEANEVNQDRLATLKNLIVIEESKLAQVKQEREKAEAELVRINKLIQDIKQKF